MRVRSVLLAAAFAAAAGRASAQLVFDGVRWQAGRVENGRVAAWQEVKVVTQAPPKLTDRLRAHLFLKNPGTHPEEGVLIRFSMTARLVPSDAAVAGAWAIPFAVDEKRVPYVAPGKTVEVVLDASPALDLYLRRLARAGWWPDRLKMQVMLEPHPGAASIKTAEDVVEFSK
ncbi:MAG: hypothetical protein HKL90_01225 [Elusimicrobia bacterium]|nr:hypothetical protein [Elusimicrobiota bacterium]